MAIGGTHDASERFIAPTILQNTQLTDLAMQEEIFGPILPIIIVDNAYDAMKIIRNR